MADTAGQRGQASGANPPRWRRMLRHRLVDEADLRRVLAPDALERLRERVQASEHHHSGEIRLCVEAGLPLSYLWKRLSARDRALTLFGKLRVWDTEANNGVLVYLLLAEHAIEIVADRALARQVPPAHWQRIVTQMQAPLREGRFEQALALAVDAADAVLRRHFPLPPGQVNPNELPDGVDLR